MPRPESMRAGRERALREIHGSYEICRTSPLRRRVTVDSDVVHARPDRLAMFFVEMSLCPITRARAEGMDRELSYDGQ